MVRLKVACQTSFLRSLKGRVRINPLTFFAVSLVSFVSFLSVFPLFHFCLVVVVAAGGSHAGASSGVVLRVSPWILAGSFRQYPFRSPESFWFSQPNSLKTT